MLSNVKQIKSKLNEIQKQIEKLEKQAHKESSKLIAKGFKEIFKKHPELESFSWTQYTPYFNDGDECVFNAHTDYISINSSEDEESSYELRQFLDVLHNPKKEIARLQKRIEEALWKDLSQLGSNRTSYCYQTGNNHPSNHNSEEHF